MFEQRVYVKMLWLQYFFAINQPVVLSKLMKQRSRERRSRLSQTITKYKFYSRAVAWQIESSRIAV